MTVRPDAPSCRTAVFWALCVRHHASPDGAGLTRQPVHTSPVSRQPLFRPTTAHPSLAVPTPAAGLAFVGLAIVGWVKRRLA